MHTRRDQRPKLFDDLNYAGLACYFSEACLLRTDNAMNEVGLDPQQAPARAELLPAADFGQQAPGSPIHGRLESEGGGGEPGPKLKLGAVRTRRLAASEAAARLSGSAYGNPLRGTRGSTPTVPIGAPLVARTDVPDAHGWRVYRVAPNGAVIYDRWIEQPPADDLERASPRPRRRGRDTLPRHRVPARRNRRALTARYGRNEHPAARRTASTGRLECPRRRHGRFRQLLTARLRQRAICPRCRLHIARRIVAHRESSLTARPAPLQRARRDLPLPARGTTARGSPWSCRASWTGRGAGRRRRAARRRVGRGPTSQNAVGLLTRKKRVRYGSAGVGRRAT